MSIYETIGEAFACGQTGKGVCVPYKYGIGSVVYIKCSAKKGTIEPITITNFSFIRDIKAFDKYFVIYNDKWYEDELVDEATARALAIAYWQDQQAWVLRQLQC